MPKRNNPDWNKIQGDASKKRTGKSDVRPKSANGGKIASIVSRGELVVQRLYSELSGKTPKYTPLGPREFVPYVHEDLTLCEIKNACHDFFSKIVPMLTNSTCDILATERGPSCSHVDQIPNVSLINVRFIPKPKRMLPSQSYQPFNSSFQRPPRPPPSAQSFSLTLPKSVSRAPVAAPSISLAKMLKMGHEIKQNSNQIDVLVKSFDLNNMCWDSIGSVPFNINNTVLGTG